MKVVLLALAACALTGAAPVAAPSAKSFEGVWKISRVVTTGANPRLLDHPQPSLLIFARGHFVIVRDDGDEPRKAAPAPKDASNPTDQEKLARYAEWAPFKASGGTYEVKGRTLVTHNLIARQVKGANVTERAVILKMERSSFVVGGEPRPDGSWGDTQITYTRVR